ncbi:MAG: ABC transporter permease [Deltaproteobacteria bacterium]|nr:ABC transporter permease [Deltaproteobacteria bacterium]
MYLPYVTKELLRHHNRTLVNVLGVAIGIALFIAINSLAAAFREASRAPLRSLGADLVLQRSESRSAPPGAPPRMTGIRLPFSNQILSAAELQKLQRIGGVGASSASLLLWEFAPEGFRTLLGIDPSGHSGLGPLKAKDWIQEGRFPERQGEVALEKHFAKFHGVRVGGEFPAGDRTLKVVGLLAVKEGSQLASANVYLTLADARALLGAGPEAVNLVHLRLRDLSALDAVKTRVTSEVPGASVTSSDSFLELMGGVSRVSDRFALLASLAALAGAVLLIVRTMLANLVERSHEIGVLKAVGWTSKDVQRQLGGEAFAQALTGGLVGIVLGYGLSSLLSLLPVTVPIPWEMNPLPAVAREAEAAAHVIRLPIRVTLQITAVSLVLSVLVGMLASLLMARRIARVKPAETLARP